MSEVRAYHPGIAAEIVVPAEAMFHLRQSGWLLRDEFDANQAAAEQAAASEPAAKAAKSTEEK